MHATVSGARAPMWHPAYVDRNAPAGRKVRTCYPCNDGLALGRGTLRAVQVLKEGRHCVAVHPQRRLRQAGGAGAPHAVLPAYACFPAFTEVRQAFS